jgi:molybdopterin/thiamine biosynthesis adenylyltransferase
MNDQQLLRYSRHILLNEIGIEGQQRLLCGKLLSINTLDMNIMRSLLIKDPSCRVCGKISAENPGGDATPQICHSGSCSS